MDLNLALVTLSLFIPANILALYVGCAMQRRRPPLWQLCAYGAGLGVVLGALRWAVFGLHVPVHALLMVLTFRYVSGGRWSLSVLAVLLVQVSAVIAEALLVVPLITALGLTLQTAMGDPKLAVAFGYLSNLPVAGMALFLWLRNRSERPEAAQ